MGNKLNLVTIKHFGIFWILEIFWISGIFCFEKYCEKLSTNSVDHVLRNTVRIEVTRVFSDRGVGVGIVYSSKLM